MAGTVALAAGLGTAAAWGRHGHHGFFKERMFERLDDVLDEDQDKLDTQALEKLRAEQVQRLEQKSRAFTEALAEMHEILTPEQRNVVVQQLKEKRHGRWGCQHE
jgi:Spy/CpxP family protein refolding chaperone